MTAQEELLLAAEALAEAVDDYREAIAYPPERSDYDEGETGDEQFWFAREFFQEDLAEAWATLAPRASELSLGATARAIRAQPPSARVQRLTRRKETMPTCHRSPPTKS